MSFPLIATIICAFWWVAEYVRSSLQQKSFYKDRDRGSSRLWDIAHFFGAIGAGVGFSRIGHLAFGQEWMPGSGVILMVGGIVFRWLSIQSLGKYFTGKVRILDGHKLVQDGIYEHVRHPAYAGTLIAYLGMGMAFSNWISLALIFLPILLAALNRIRVEEAALREAFGDEYVEYSTATNRLIPRIY